MKRIFTAAGLALAICMHAQNPQYSFPDNFDKEYYSYESVVPGLDCLDKTVVLKINPAFREFCGPGQINIPAIQQLFNFAQSTSLKKLYPNHKPPVKTVDQYGRQLVDLSLIYEVSYNGTLDLRKLITELNGLDAVEYAQPRMIAEPQWIPNDDSISVQWGLSKVRAFQAWDLDTGSYNVIIGVVDGGTNFTHPDLMANVHYNMGDTIDGVDNDNDGFIDNYRGWDTGDNDNNPQYIGGFNSAHGTSMCGLAAGTPNNVVGVAGTGYRCSYLPVKMVNSSYGWIAGYEGLVYAADHGSQVINASWGGTIAGPYEKDVVQYITVNLGSALFAAAGNSNNTVPYYPASFDHVVCVAGSDSMDFKSPGSSYYEMVDISSPGQRICEPYATGWGYGYGTSDASAFTSGAAGLVQSYYPGLLPMQVGAVLQQSSYRIDTIPANAPYANKQGAGRLDMFAALTNPFKPFIEFNDRQYTDNNDNVFMIGDTVELSGNMLNLLDTSTALLKAVITDNSPYVQWLDSVVTLGTINTLNYTNTSAQPYRFKILPGCPSNQSVLLKVRYIDGPDPQNSRKAGLIFRTTVLSKQSKPGTTDS